MDFEVNIGSKNQYPFMTFLSLNNLPDENFVELSKNVISESNLDQRSLTNGLLLELWSLVEIQQQQDQDISPGKISRRQFSEIIGFFLFKWSANEITRDFIKKYANPRDYKTLKMKVSSGTVSEHSTWEKGSKLLARIAEKCDCTNKENVEGDQVMVPINAKIKPSNNGDMKSNASATPSGNLDNAPKEINAFHAISDKNHSEQQQQVDGELAANVQANHVKEVEADVQHEGLVAEPVEQSQVPQVPVLQEQHVVDGDSGVCPHLSRLGLLDNSNSRMQLKNFEGWFPLKEHVTNGVIIELADNFNDVKTMKLLSRKLCKLMKVHDSHLDKIFELRFKQYISRTKLYTGELESQWIFFDHLEEGGKLFRSELMKPKTKFDETIHNLVQANHEQFETKICSLCGSTGDFFACQGCFSVVQKFAKRLVGSLSTMRIVLPLLPR